MTYETLRACVRLVDAGESTTDTETDMSSPMGSIVCKMSLDDIGL